MHCTVFKNIKYLMQRFSHPTFFFKRETLKHYLQYLMQCFGLIQTSSGIRKLEKTFASYGGEQMHITRLLAIY